MSDSRVFFVTDDTLKLEDFIEFADKPDSIGSVSINCRGGYVFDAFALANCVREYRPAVPVYVAGVAIGAAVLLLGTGGKVSMDPAALIGFTESSAGYVGTAEGTESVHNLEIIDQSMADFLGTARGIEPGLILDWMRTKRWFNADQALETGLIDEVKANQ